MGRPLMSLAVAVCAMVVLSGAAVDDMFALLVAERRVPGISLAVVNGGQSVIARGFGTTAPNGGRAVGSETQYRLASVSKVFTATGVMALAQDGRVTLDAPARMYCPVLAALKGAPTVRHFLMHRSGMRHTSDAEDTTIKGAPARFSDSLKKIVTEPLRFTPGTKTLYTSWGYTVLGCVIESASGRSYADFLRTRIFTPAGLTATTFDEPTYSSATFSQGFRRGLLGFGPSEVVDTRFKTPASGIISTVNDMARFAVALLDDKVLDDSLVSEMFRVVRDGDGNAGFTAGWTPKGKIAAGRVFDYNGSMEGVTAFLEVVPERRYVLALLANRERYVPELQPLVNRARQIVLNEPTLNGR
jgi:serine beta-lactamase-like protein LACTB, mitochondrial